MRRSVIQLILFVLSLGTVEGDLQIYFLDSQLCNVRLNMSNYNDIDLHSFRLKLSQEHYYPHNLNCSLQIQAEKDSENIMFYFKQFDIRPEVVAESCRYDWLELHDGNSTDSQYICGFPTDTCLNLEHLNDAGLDTKLCGIFPSRTRGIYFTRSNFLTLYFKSDEGEKYTGFDMVITRYRYGECRSDEFSCANGRCIDQSLKCNGYNPCGDGSDCPSLHRGYIMAIVFGILALVSLATSTFLAWKLKREKRGLQQNVSTLADDEIRVDNSWKKTSKIPIMQVDSSGEKSLLIPNGQSPKRIPQIPDQKTQRFDSFKNVHKQTAKVKVHSPVSRTEGSFNSSNLQDLKFNTLDSSCESNEPGNCTRTRKMNRNIITQENGRHTRPETSPRGRRNKAMTMDSGILCSGISATPERDTTHVKTLYTSETVVKEIYSGNSTHMKQPYSGSHTPSQYLSEDEDSSDYITRMNEWQENSIN